MRPRTVCCLALVLAAVAGTLSGMACRGKRADTPATIRLVDLFTPATITGTGATDEVAGGVRSPASDGAAAVPISAAGLVPTQRVGTIGVAASPPGGMAPAAPPAPAIDPARWTVGPGIADVERSADRLAGRSTTGFPILHLERTEGRDDPDLIHAIEVRMRASAGTSLAMQTSAAPKVDLPALHAAGRGLVPWIASTPLHPGDELQTYTLVPSPPVAASRARHLLLHPTDVAGATFEIASVRVVMRREYLATIESGIGWQGLGNVFREALVARAPERIQLPLDLPARARLDVAVGTIDEGPVTFRVHVRAEGAPTDQGIVVDRTVTQADRWQPFSIDLSALGERRATVALSLAGAEPGRLGFWGTPVVRSPMVAATGAPRGAGDAAPAARPQGVVLVQLDTLRRDHLDLYGHGRETAPVLRRMAAEGVSFRNAVSQGSWTKVASPSILTSLYPSTHGIRAFADRLPASATTIAEVYRAAGYATLSLSSIPFTGQFTALHQGFEELHESSSLGEREGPYSSKTSREYVDRLLEWVGRHRDTPFFVYLHVFDPHSPYEPRTPYNGLFVDAATRERHLRDREAVTPLIKAPFMRVRQLPTRDEVLAAKLDPRAYIDVELGWYDGSIRGADVEMGRLLEGLRTLGLDDRTLVAVTSDHGTEFHDHGRMWHGHSVYGELIDVPLVVRWPGGVPRGRSVAELVQTIDLMPTLLELSGLATPRAAQGQSLVPLFASSESRTPDARRWKPRPAVAERAPMAPNLPFPLDRISYAMLEGQWKLVHNTTAGLPAYELYDREKDPLDTRDVAASHPQVVERLSAMLARWRRMAEAARIESDAEMTKHLDPQDVERLRSLGYVQ